MQNSNDERENKIGFAAQKNGLISFEEQKEDLIAYGVKDYHVHDPSMGIDAVLSDLGEDGDELVVYSTMVFTNQKEYRYVVEQLAKKDLYLVVLRPKETLRIKAIDSMPYINGLKDLNKRNAALGAEHGRQKLITTATAKKIKHFVTIQGNTQAEAAIRFKTSTRAVSDIMNDKYFLKNRGKK